MSDAFLEITYRHGKPFAAYLRLPRRRRAKVSRTAELRPGILVDFDSKGTPMGVEIVHPSSTAPEIVLEVLAEVHAAAVDAKELAPLRAA